MQFANKTIFEEKAVTKSERRQVHYPRKFIPRKLQILAVFGDPRNIIPSKILGLTVVLSTYIMLNMLLSLVLVITVTHLYYRIARNVGGGKHWRIWRIDL